MCADPLYKLCLTFLILRRILRDTVINVHRLSLEFSIILVKFS